MVAAVIVCATAAVQAASFTWTSGNYSYIAAADGTRIQNKSGTGNYTYDAVMNGGNIVLVYLGTGTADWSKAQVLESKTIKGTTGEIYTSTPSSKKGLVSNSFAFSFDDDTTIRDGAIFGVMYQAADGALSKLVYVDSTGKIGDEIETTYTVSGLKGDDWSGDKFTFTTAGTSTSVMNNFTVQSVPEPTSAMLLLLGIGAMALRRRRA